MAEHEYEARGPHSKIFGMTDREVLLSGPASTGADRAIMEKLATCAMTHRGFRGLIVRKVEKSLALTVIPILERRVLRELIASRGVKFFNASTREPQRYEFGNGSVIVVTGIDDSRKIAGSEWDMVCVVNATDLDLVDWEDLSMSCSGDAMGYTQLIACTLPDKPGHWLNQRCREGRTIMLDSRHEDNPEIYARADGHLKITDHGRVILSRLNDLTGVNRSRKALGLWVDAEGMIWEKWDPAIHLINDYPPPIDWARVWGVDWGTKHPCAWGNWVREPDGRMTEYQEILMTGWTVEQLAETILDATTRDGQPRPEAIVADHDLENIAKLEKILAREWGFEYEVTLARKAVKAGIDAFAKRLKNHDVAVMRGAPLFRDPALLEMQRPTCLAEQIPSYVWADGGRDQPLKRDDDSCDQARYVIMYEDAATGRWVRMRGR